MITPKLEAGLSKIAEAEDQCEGTPHQPENSSNNKNFVKQFLVEVRWKHSGDPEKLGDLRSIDCIGDVGFSSLHDLRNGIIDNEEDVKFLREKCIVLNHLKSDEEVAKLFNGMNKSISLNKVPFLDNVIEDANKYCNGRWKVKMRKFFKTYVFGSWQFLALLAAILLVLLMTLQAFFSVYRCRRIFHIDSIGNLQ
ncbi:hypothetical protein M0R45_031480 [Rubus argutus]|uniref:Uncharacterized protein n=1 Tax=Rubus argutus TaxID=59490 RepID=A0AAW1WDQ2_RUBAR